MSEIQTAEKVVISNDCICEEVFDLTEDQDPSTMGCWGCFDDAEEELNGMILRWYQANAPECTETVRIEGKGMTWQSLEGYATVPLNGVADALRLNADWTLTFTLDGKTLTAVRSSHDEPCGASFTFTFVEQEDIFWNH